MRVIVVADIHGNDTKFRRALKSVSLKKTDILVLIGDLIDRGTESKQVLDTIFLLEEKGFSNIIYIRGNHEQMLLDSIEDENKEYIWLKNGGDKTLQSFKVKFAFQIPKKYIEFINSSLMYYEYENFIFVHAGLNLNIENPFEDTKSLLWSREFDESKLINSSLSNKIVIHGHTPIHKNKILENFKRFKVINIDNGVYFNEDEFGSLTIIDITNKKINFIK